MQGAGRPDIVANMNALQYATGMNSQVGKRLQTDEGNNI